MKRPRSHFFPRRAPALLLALGLFCGCASTEGERLGFRERMAAWREAMRPRFGPVENYGFDSRAREIEHNLGASGSLRQQAW